MAEEAKIVVELQDKSKEAAPQQPTSAPAPPPAPERVKGEDISEVLHGIGGGVVEGLYKGLFDALQAGKSKFAGVPDPVLAKAKPFYEQGLIGSPEDLRKLVNAGYDPTLAGLSPASTQEAAAQPEENDPDAQTPEQIEGRQESFEDKEKPKSGRKKGAKREGEEPAAEGTRNKNKEIERLRKTVEHRREALENPEWAKLLEENEELKLQVNEARREALSNVKQRRIEEEAAAAGVTTKDYEIRRRLDEQLAKVETKKREGELIETLPEYEPLRPKSKPTKTPEELAQEAKERAIAAGRQKRIFEEITAKDPEYQELYGFNPYEQAKLRREAERRRAQSEQAYSEMYGGEQKGIGGAALDMMNTLRGTLGGIFGPVAGVILDAVQGIRKSYLELAQEAQRKLLIQEAGSMPKPSLTISSIAPPVTPATTPSSAPTGGPPASTPPPSTPPASTSPTTTAPPPPPTSVGLPPLPRPTGPGAGGGSGGGGIAGGIVTALPYVALAVAGIEVFKVAVDTFSKSAERYGEYSPVIAQAQAMNEIRTVMNDLRRSRENEKELADLITQQNKLQQEYENVKMAIGKKILPVITDILKVVTKLLGATVDSKEDSYIIDPTSILLKDYKPPSGATTAVAPLISEDIIPGR